MKKTPVQTWCLRQPLVNAILPWEFFKSLTFSLEIFTSEDKTNINPIMLLVEADINPIEPHPPCVLDIIPRSRLTMLYFFMYPSTLLLSPAQAACLL